MGSSGLEPRPARRRTRVSRTREPVSQSGDSCASVDEDEECVCLRVRGERPEAGKEAPMSRPSPGGQKGKRMEEEEEGHPYPGAECVIEGGGRAQSQSMLLYPLWPPGCPRWMGFRHIHCSQAIIRRKLWLSVCRTSKAESKRLVNYCPPSARPSMKALYCATEVKKGRRERGGLRGRTCCKTRERVRKTNVVLNVVSIKV